MNNRELIYRKITKQEFDKLKNLFPDNDEMWTKYKNKKLQQFNMNEIGVYVVEDSESFCWRIVYKLFKPHFKN